MERELMIMLNKIERKIDQLMADRERVTLVSCAVAAQRLGITLWAFD